MKHVDENDESHNTSNDNKQKNGKHNNNNGNGNGNGNIFEEDNGERMGFGSGHPVECATQ